MAELDIKSAPPRSNADTKPILLVVESPRPNQVITPSSAIVIQGFAVAAAEIDEVVVECADIVQLASYGLYRDDLAKAYPKYPRLAQSGFSCEITREQLANLPAAAASDGVALNIIARDRKGREQKVQSVVRLKAPRAELPSVDFAVDPAMVLQVDERTINKRGVLRVRGWVLAHSPISEVNIFIDGGLVGPAQLSLERPDVALAWPQFAKAAESGFLLVADIADLLAEGRKADARQIRVVARAVGGISREAKFPLEAPAAVSRRKQRDVNEFFCDDVRLTKNGALSLSGWTVSSLGIDKIRVDFEGESLGFAEYGYDRPDVGNKFPSITQSRKSGFSFRADIDPAKIAGENAVSIETIFRDGSHRRNKIFVAAIETAEMQRASTAAAAEEIYLHIDEPQIADGNASRLIEGTFAINGWAVAKAGVDSIDFDLDGTNVGTAYYGIRREDVAKAFPHYSADTALLSGFAFSLPHRFLTEGQHKVTVKIRTKSNAEKAQSFLINVGAVGEQPGPWSLRERLPAAELLFQERVQTQFKLRPTFYICVNCRHEKIASLASTLRSIAAQSYPDWTVVIAGDAKIAPAVERVVRAQFGAIWSRIFCVPSSEDADKLTEQARPRDFVLPLDAGDVLAADALFEFAVAINRNETTDFIYADERRHNIGTSREDAYFKPDWSPTLLMASNYIGRPWCAPVARFQACERDPFRSQIANFDSVLHLTEAATQIAHVQRILSRRGADNIETPEAEKRALKSALKRRRLDAIVEDGRIANTYRCRPKAMVEGLVSIVIPTCASRGLIRVCLDSLRNVSTYRNFEVICIENIADQASEWKAWLHDNCDVVVEIREKFNWSLFNNVAAREASGEYLLFLNDDIEIIQPDWLEAMLDVLGEDEVGIVGPQLLYPDGKVQHAGMFLAGGSLARHAFRFCAEDDPGYFGLALTQRDVMAVTGACMLMKTETYENLGMFDESHSVINNDLDFCLKAHEQKLRCVYTPFAQLIHHELASRKDIKDEHDTTAFDARWASLTARGDPFFHPVLDRNSDHYQVDSEPTEIIFAGHPLFEAGSVRRILAIKVDHIGDFITAFPAFRRLKSHFPHAELVVLAAPASRHLAKLEPAIDRLIPFEFFHARSQLGATELSKERLLQLQQELEPLAFDIAIDLRKHADTRLLLQHAGARTTAGFNHHNEFPWLDIALAWDGDAQMARKRHHVSDDLVNLVDAVAAAGAAERAVIRRPEDWSARQASVVARLRASGLYRRRVVCVHPASGTEMRQWPAIRFAEVINALLATEDVDVAMIGGPDEAEFATKVQEHIQLRNRIFDLIGKLKLDELPHFIDTCALFIGNNSGPKHIAAAIGVPTIGVHSGVVDAREWGPLGIAAVAVQRNMACSPCYLANRQQCHRGLACLENLTAAHLLDACVKFLRLDRGIQIA